MHRILTQSQRDALDEWMKREPDERRRNRPKGKRR